MAKYVDTNAGERDMVLVTPSYYLQPLNYYDRNDLPLKKGFPEDGRKVIDKNDIAMLRKAVAHYNRVWLILSECGDKEKKIEGALTQSYNLSYHKEFKHINLYLFEKRYASTAFSLPGS